MMQCSWASVSRETHGLRRRRLEQPDPAGRHAGPGLLRPGAAPNHTPWRRRQREHGTATAKGLTRGRVMPVHILHNSMIPWPPSWASTWEL
ncbi:hypothetical protein QJS66_12035 [Kocuria rhizophila]|nr:hypothetical protein QJS66_12035 [Kocuria rhizophila]